MPASVELEAFPRAPVIGAEPELHQAIVPRLFGRYEMVWIQFVWRLEKDTGAMFLFALGRKRCPDSVLRGNAERLAVFSLSLEPFGDVIGEHAFRQRHIH